MNYPDRIKYIVENASAQIALIGEDEMGKKPHLNKWSKKEIIGHLIDSAFNNHARFLKAALQDDLIFEGYDQDAWVELNAYQQRSTPEILELWAVVNEHVSFVVKGIPESLMHRKTTKHHFHKMCMQLLAEGEASSLSYLIWDYIYHMEYHLKQVIDGYQEVNDLFIQKK